MQPKPGVRRRTLFKGISAGSLLPLLGGTLIGCSGKADSGPEESMAADFLHGVASLDPLEDRVILWTRVTPEREGNVIVKWEIAANRGFTAIVTSGSGRTGACQAYAFKVKASGLDPDTRYFYRFRTGDRVSSTGLTRTAVRKS